MMARLRYLTLTLAITTMLTCVSCTSYEEKKAAAHLRFDRATVKAKIPLAEDLFRNGQIEDAQKTVQECLKVDPENPNANLLMGKIHMEYGRSEVAREHLLMATEYDAQLDEGWWILGEIAHQDKKPGKALEYFEKALKLKPLDIRYILSVGETNAMLGDYSKSLDLYEQKSQFLPGKSDLKVAAGDVMHRMGDVDGATVRYRQAMLLNPEDVGAMESLGYCYITKERWSEATDIFGRLVEKSEGERKSTYTEMLAMCSMKSGQYGKAVSSYDKLSVDRRDDATLWLQMGQAALGVDSPNRALACAQRALSLRPGWSKAVAVKGCAEYLKSNYTESINTFSSICSDDQMGGFAWLMTGRNYQQLGQLTEAQRAYDNAAKLDPDNKLVSLLANAQP